MFQIPPNKHVRGIALPSLVPEKTTVKISALWHPHSPVPPHIINIPNQSSSDLEQPAIKFLSLFHLVPVWYYPNLALY